MSARRPICVSTPAVHSDMLTRILVYLERTHQTQAPHNVDTRHTHTPVLVAAWWSKAPLKIGLSCPR
jgi:hypothetical protein